MFKNNFACPSRPWQRRGSFVMRAQMPSMPWQDGTLVGIHKITGSVTAFFYSKPQKNCHSYVFSSELRFEVALKKKPLECKMVIPCCSMQSLQPLQVLQRQIAAICDLFITSTPRLSSHVCSHCGSLMRDGQITLQIGALASRHASNIDADDALEISDIQNLCELQNCISCEALLSCDQ